MRFVLLITGLMMVTADIAAARTMTLTVRGRTYTCDVVGTTVSCDVDGATVEFDGGDRLRRSPATSPSSPSPGKVAVEPPRRERLSKARPVDQPPAVAPRSDKPAIMAQGERLYQSIVIRSDRAAEIDALIDRILRDKEQYQLIAQLSGVPWQVIGVIHTMESSGDFSKHLHNGDPLTQRTVRVPRGRPTKSEPPFNWIDSAADALEYDGLDKAVADYATVGGILYWLESYNGFGYRDRGINSPYLWACTQHYDRGLYVSDGVFDANRRSDACGSGAMLQRMVERGEFNFPRDEARNAPATTGSGSP